MSLETHRTAWNSCRSQHPNWSVADLPVGGVASPALSPRGAMAHDQLLESHLMGAGRQVDGGWGDGSLQP